MKKHFECKSRRGGCIWSLVKLGIVLVILLAVIVYFTMGYIADYALGKVTKGTGIDAGVSSLMVSPFSQEISVGGFYITNPPGYSPNNAFAFKEAYISTDLSPSKLLGEKLITINEIRIIGLDMSVELKTGTGLSALLSAPKSNLTEIADILKKKAGMDKAKDDQAAETAAPAEKDESEPMKFIVKKIVFADGKARGGLNEKSVEIALPSFNIENIGVRENGNRSARQKGHARRRDGPRQGRHKPRHGRGGQRRGRSSERRRRSPQGDLRQLARTPRNIKERKQQPSADHRQSVLLKNTLFFCAIINEEHVMIWQRMQHHTSKIYRTCNVLTSQGLVKLGLRRGFEICSR